MPCSPAPAVSVLLCRPASDACPRTAIAASGTSGRSPPSPSCAENEAIFMCWLACHQKRSPGGEFALLPGSQRSIFSHAFCGGKVLLGCKSHERSRNLRRFLTNHKQVNKESRRSPKIEI